MCGIADSGEGSGSGFTHALLTFTKHLPKTFEGGRLYIRAVLPCDGSDTWVIINSLAHRNKSRVFGFAYFSLSIGFPLSKAQYKVFLMDCLEFQEASGFSLVYKSTCWDFIFVCLACDPWQGIFGHFDDLMIACWFISLQSVSVFVLFWIVFFESVFCWFSLGETAAGQKRIHTKENSNYSIHIYSEKTREDLTVWQRTCYVLCPSLALPTLATTWLLEEVHLAWEKNVQKLPCQHRNRILMPFSTVVL